MADQIKVSVTAEDEGVSTLLRTLSKQLGEVQKAQTKVAAGANEAARAQNALGKSVNSVIGHLRGLAIGYAALRVGRFVKDQIDAADALNDLSERTGVATETLSVLAHAGETADLTVDQLEAGIRAFAKTTGDLASGGKEAAEAFRKIGLGAKDLQGATPDDALKKTLTTLGTYRDDLAKSEVAQKLFGKSGTELIPLANKMADEGFGTLEAAAASAGRVISKDAAQAAADFNDQIDIMKGRAAGVALAFGQELVPALSDVFTVLQDVRGEGEKSFAQTFGEGAANLVKTFVVQTMAGFETIKGGFKIFAEGGIKAFEAVKAAASFNFPDAKRLLRESGDVFNQLNGLAIRSLNDATLKLDQAEQKRNAATVAARKKREANERKRRIQVEANDTSDLAKARLDAEEHARESEGKILAASLALRDQEVEQSFSKGLSSLADYFAARRKTIVEAGAQEIAALKATRDALAKQPVANEVEQVKRDDSVAQKDAELRVKEIAQKQALAKLDNERADVTKALSDIVVDAETRMQTARGNTSAEAKRTLEQDVENYRLTLAKIGKLTADQQANAVTEFKVTLTLDVDAKANQEKIDSLFGEIDRKRTELDQRVSLGLQSQASAQRELVGFEQARLPALKAAADEAQRLAGALDNDELRAAAADLQVKIAGVGQAVQESARLAAEFGSNIADAAGDNLEEFLGTTVSQVHSVGEAFASLATSVVADVQRIIAALLRAKFVEGIAKLLGGIGGSALPAIDAAGGSATSGFGFAGGGYTGPGGKYQPAGIVHRGEYVFPQEAVRRLGISRLDAMAGLRTPNIRRPRRGYAEGGLAVGSTAHTFGGSIAIDVSHDGTKVLSADAFIASPSGEKAVLKVLARHKGKLGLG